MKIANIHGNLDPRRHFLVYASGDYIDGSNTPIKDGDLFLFELNSGGTISNQIFAGKYQDECGDISYMLK